MDGCGAWGGGCSARGGVRVGGQMWVGGRGMHISLSLKPPCPSPMSPRSPMPLTSCLKQGTSSSSAPGQLRSESVCAGGKRLVDVPEPGDGDGHSVSPGTVPVPHRQRSAWLLPSPAGPTWVTPSSWRAGTLIPWPPAPPPALTPSAKVSSGDTQGTLGTGHGGGGDVAASCHGRPG